VSVVGLYWISSKTSLRCTTEPGVVATLTPIVNFEASTLAGMRGDVDMSRSRFLAPASRFAPPLSSVAFSAAGLDHKKFVGASASAMTANLNSPSAAQSSSASLIRSSAVARTAR
jgi:hypothetical protein